MSGRAPTIVALFAALLFGAPEAKSRETGAETTLSAARRLDIDNAVHGQVAKCWSLPQPIAVHSITMGFELKSDGSLVAAPAIVEKTPEAPDVAVKAAIAAIRNCTPLKLPPDAHAYWRQVKIKFQTQHPARPFGASAWPQ